MYNLRDIEEFPDEEPHIEDRGTKVKDYEEHSLTTEERDEIIRKYNAELSIRRITPDIGDGLEQSDKSMTDSGDSTDGSEVEGIKRRYLTKDELAELFKEFNESFFRKESTETSEVREINDETDSYKTHTSRDLDPEESQEFKASDMKRFEKQEYLQRHPYLVDSPQYDKLNRYLDLYWDLKQSEISTPQELHDFANSNDIEYLTARSWHLCKRQPEYFSIVESHDRANERFMNSISEQARENLIDSSDIYHALRPLRDLEDPSVNQIAEAIMELCPLLDEDNRLEWGRLYPYHAKGPLWLKDVGERIAERREEVERSLNEKLGLNENPNEEIRVGVVGNKLYLRLKDTQLHEWSNLYSEENFHMETIEDKKNLIVSAREALGLKGNIQLGRLAGQIGGYSRTISGSNTNADLRYTHSHIIGGTVDLLNDALGQTLNDIQGKIDYIGRGKCGFGVIRNPQLDTDPEKVLVPLISIIRSDGHIEPTYHVRYTEGRPERVDIVKELFNQLGFVDMTEEIDDKGNITLHLPAVVGRLLGKVGMKTGDKAIQNEPLEDIVMNASPERIKDYVRELIPEDGSFAVESGIYGEFQWYRSLVLDAGVKAENYTHTPLISDEEIEFIKNQVEPQVMDFGSDENREVYTMRIGHLNELMIDSDSNVSAMATRLHKTINSCRSKLMDDEQAILARIGISTRSYSTNIRVFKDTGRVSVAWQAQTATTKDAITWAREAMPNDYKKKKSVEEWLDSLE